MALTVGEKVGPYEVIGLLGTGGMGEVYRARDAQLGRDVALKVLTPALAQELGYLARFQREAHTLASLNHPHIAAIYGLEEGAIVMEVVEGRTLAEIDRPPLEDALSYARQIAEALEAAHERGIIHRDLKPANVKVTPSGEVKVLDFGLAMVPDNSGSVTRSPADSPTLTLRATQAGIILGTAAYMSPEQAAGKPLDRRTDIWSFGVVLFEMLTGERLFVGETVSHVLADVLRADIDFRKLPADTPPAVRELVRRCLDRRVRCRLQWIGEARVILENYTAEPVATPVSSPVRRATWLPWAVAAVLGAIAAITGFTAWRATRPPDEPLVRLTASLGRSFTLPRTVRGPSPLTGPAVVLSADGSRIAFVSEDTAGRTALYTRSLNESESRKLSGTDDASAPFFSPDGRWIGFFAGGKLRKIAVEGGAPIDLCDVLSGLSASWSDDGFIVANLGTRTPIARLPDSGGAPLPITKLQGDEESHRWPQMLPGSKVLLYAVGRPAYFKTGKIVAQRVGSDQRVVLASDAMFPRYVGDGILTYVRGNTLFGVAFDPERLEVRGSPVPLLQDLRSSPDSGGAQIAFSQNGTAAFRKADSEFGAASPVGWIEPSGKFEPVAAVSLRLIQRPRLSPDGRRFVYEQVESLGSSLWIQETNTTVARRITFEPGLPSDVVWTPDSQRVLYRVNRPDRASELHFMRADGGGKPVPLRMEDGIPKAFTPDGRKLIYTAIGKAPCRIAPINGLPDNPVAGPSEPCFASAPSRFGTISSLEVSPDGKWLAYALQEPETHQVYICSLPDRGGKWQVSTQRGLLPQWSSDGRRVYFLGGDNRIKFVDLEFRGDAVFPGPEKGWSHAVLSDSRFSISRDGKRALSFRIAGQENQTEAQVELLLHFTAEARRRLRGSG